MANNNHSGWAKIPRSILEMPWSNNPNVMALYAYLILKVNYIEGVWNDIAIKPGQHLTSRSTLSRNTGLSERQVRSAITTLKKSKILTCETTNKYSLITLCDFGGCIYTQNSNDQQNDQQNNQQNDQQTSCSATTIEEVEEVISNDITKETIIESLNSLALNFFDEDINAKAKRLLLQLAQHNGIGDDVVDAFIMANLNNMGRNNDKSHPYAICDSKGATIRKVAEAFIAFSKRHNDKVPPFDVVERIFVKRIALKGGRADGLKASDFYEYLKSTGKQYKGDRGIVSAANAWINKRIE